MRGLNVTVSPALLDAIRMCVEEEGLSSRKLAQAVAELSLTFTKERDSLSVSYLNDRLLGMAYLQYFLPVNLVKIQLLLDEMPFPQTAEKFSVLDLGSGPGTGALAVLDWWHQRGLSQPLSLIAVDGSVEALKQVRQLWDRYCGTANIEVTSLQTYEGDLRQRAWMEQVKHRAPFDLIVLANCLNELYADVQNPIEMRTTLLTNCLSLLTTHGTLMIVEPALRETSRALLQVRDKLLREKHCTVFSPCLHEQNCPALVKPDDWCHDERAWEAPAVIQQIDAEVGFIKDALKFSYLLLRKDGQAITERRSDVYRVVSELRVMKGEKRAWLCNEQGRQEIGRQDRLVSPENEAFDQWHRGAIVQIEKIAHKEKGSKVSALGRIEQHATVKIVRPA